jgi:integrase
MIGKPRKVMLRGEARWVVDARDPVSRKRQRFYLETRAKADEKQRELNQAPEPAVPLIPECDPDVTVAAFTALWIAEAAAGWQPRTRRSYADTMRLHVHPFVVGPGARTVGDLPVREWPRGLVQAIVKAQADAGYARDSVRIVVVTLRKVLTAAVRKQLLAHHPMNEVVRDDLKPYLRKKQGEQGAPKAFTVAQARKFLAVAREHSALFPLYATGFNAGLRLGELCGLQLEDDHMVAMKGGRARQLTVARSLGQEQSMRDPKPGPTKTGRAREVDVGADLGAILDTLKADRPKLALRHGWRPVPPWMFVTSNGTPYSERNVLTDFTRVLDLAGLADTGLSPHGMRHSFACAHIAAGKSAQWIKQQMGHSSIKITLDVYADWFQLRDHAAADELGVSLLAGDAVGDKG